MSRYTIDTPGRRLAFDENARDYYVHFTPSRPPALAHEAFQLTVYALRMLREEDRVEDVASQLPDGTSFGTGSSDRSDREASRTPRSDRR